MCRYLTSPSRIVLSRLVVYYSSYLLEPSSNILLPLPPEQDARKIGFNTLVCELLKTLLELIRHGFVTTTELAPMLPTLVAMLDGHGDIVDEGEHANKTDRYRVKVNVKTNTVKIMECKLVVCQILSLVCTVQLDVRLSLLLNHFRHEMAAGIIETTEAADKGEEADDEAVCCKPLLLCMERAGCLEDTSGGGRKTRGGYVKLDDNDEGAPSSLVAAAKAMHGEAKDASHLASYRKSEFDSVIDFLKLDKTVSKSETGGKKILKKSASLLDFKQYKVLPHLISGSGASLVNWEFNWEASSAEVRGSVITWELSVRDPPVHYSEYPPARRVPTALCHPRLLR